MYNDSFLERVKYMMIYTLENGLEVSFYLWMLHLVLPVLDASGESIYGYTLLVMELFMLFMQVLALQEFELVFLEYYPVILSYPFYFFGWLFLYKNWGKYTGLVLAVLSMLATLSYLFNLTIPVNSFTTTVPVTLSVGFYSWLLSCGVLMAGSLYQLSGKPVKC